MKYHKNIFINLIFISLIVFSNCHDKINYKTLKNGIEIQQKEITTRIVFYKDNIVRIVKWPRDGSAIKISLSVVKDTSNKVDYKLFNTKEDITIESNSLKILVNKKTGNILFNDKTGNIYFKEKGKPLFKKVIYSGDTAFNIKQFFEFLGDEAIYGFGQHQNGVINYRNKSVVLVQSNTDAVIPFFVSTKNYGILWDNYSKTIFSDENNTYLWSDFGDQIDYYFILGQNMDSVISGYRYLTGKVPLYGKWAYGYWQSKEHYDNQNELMSVARKYRHLKIPIDNIIQDWDYWNGRENWGGMFFDKTLYPDPDGMIKKLHKMHFHIMISIWPAVGPNTAIYKELNNKGYLYSPTGWAGFKYYDAFNPEANTIYFKYLKKGLLSKGIDAWWIDSTEPDVINALTKESEEYELKKMGRNTLGSWARYLNVFSLVMTDALYKNLRKENQKKRVYILTRSTFAGQQRNAATTWSGDIGANWEVFKNQITAGINHSMAGIPYWTFDIGAFVLGAYDGVFVYGGKDPAYQELYTRMFQFGAFCPIFRSHGSETPREIWEFGEFTPILIKFDNLRYRLLPYIYSMAWLITSKDYTIMRALAMDFSHDKNTYNISDQYMFGNSIMVCPVTEFMKYRPPEPSIPVASKHFRTKKGKKGLDAKYFSDPDFKNLTLTKIDTSISIYWYTGRPNYVTDSSYSIIWEGKLIPTETGKHQFHLKSFDKKKIFINGKELKMIYTSTEQYTEIIDLEKNKEYDFKLTVSNNSSGAARMLLYWKTPSIFAKEKTPVNKKFERVVYLPAGCKWYDFWTGQVIEGGRNIIAQAPLDIIPLYIKAGSIIPMGPFIQYSTEKNDPIEIRIYKGDDGYFLLYEDENDGYNYEKGIYSTIEFKWNDKENILEISDRKRSFPGMLQKRTFNIVIVDQKKGTGIEYTNPDKVVNYNGKKISIKF